MLNHGVIEEVEEFSSSEMSSSSNSHSSGLSSGSSFNIFGSAPKEGKSKKMTPIQIGELSSVN